MEITFWSAFNILVMATVVLLAFFTSYYLLAVKKHFPKRLSGSCTKLAQGFMLLFGLSAISIVGGMFGALPLGRMNALSMLMLPSLMWALLLLYQGARKLGKSAKGKSLNVPT